MRCSQVNALREVVSNVVQLPLLLLTKERHHAKSIPRHTPVETRCNPTIVINRAVTEHFEVLRGALARTVATFHGVQHRHAVYWQLLQAIHNGRNINASSSQQRGHHINNVMELRTQTTGFANACRPLNSHGITCATKVRRHLLHPLERRVKCPCPRKVVVVLTTSGAEVIHVLKQPLRIFRNAVLERWRTPCTVNSAFCRRTIVTCDVHKQCVVGFAHFFHGVEHASDLCIGVSEETCKHFHETRCNGLVTIGVFLPRWHFIGARRKSCSCRDYTQS